MGSVNSTVTNIFYNNTTGTQDHALLSNLSYADSNHTGFQSSSTLDNDIASLGYVTNTTGNFINKSGDIYSGQYNHTNSLNWSLLGGMKNTNNPFRVVNNEKFTTELRGNGIQNWWLYSASNNSGAAYYGESQGWIGYSYPGAGVGIAFRNGANINTTVMHMCARNGLSGLDNASYAYGLCFGASPNSSTPGDQIEFDTSGNITIKAISGSGTPRPLCEQSGKIVICP